MTEQNENSANDTRRPPNLELLYAMGPLYRRLIAAGVTRLHVEYDVWREIGAIECQARNALEQVVTSQVDDDLKKDVLAFMVKLIDHRYPDWSRDAGASGRFDWNLRSHEFVHKHHRRTVTVTTIERKGL